MSNYAFEIKTVQASAFKTLVEALKELLTDTCIEFDNSGIKISALETSKIVLVHLKLNSSEFEFYQCDNPVSIGINMLNFHKIIKTINSNDTLTFYMDKNDPNHLNIKIESSEKNTRTNYKLDLLDYDEPQPSINSTVFNSMITLPSSDFQKICRDMNNLSDLVEIKNINKQLIFTCKGDFCEQETILCDSGNNEITDSNSVDIIQGVFKLKYLVHFTKCTNLSNTVEIYLKNDYPLIVKYAVASLGEIKLCLAPERD
jgi:proliferating cell nuclear antigen